MAAQTCGMWMGSPILVVGATDHLCWLVFAPMGCTSRQEGYMLIKFSNS